MDYAEELYAERLRLKAQAERLASGQAGWTDQLDNRVRLKLSLAWDDLINHVAFSTHADEVEN